MMAQVLNISHMQCKLPLALETYVRVRVCVTVCLLCVCNRYLSSPVGGLWEASGEKRQGEENGNERFSREEGRREEKEGAWFEMDKRESDGGNIFKTFHEL